MSLSIGIEEIEKELTRKEKTLDELIVGSRSAVRFCANCIKCIHAKDTKEAKKNLEEAGKLLEKVSKYGEEYYRHVDHIYQEYVEAAVLLAVTEGKVIPSFKKLDSPIVPYLNGLLDCTGELKREMYEHLRKGEKKQAEKYFSLMEEIFHELLHLRFSNSVLPDFRRKQDVARIQIEQARGELL